MTQNLKSIRKALFLFLIVELIIPNVAQAFILPESAIWGNQAPQERPREYYQQPQPNDRRRYDRYSSTRQERRQNKTYYSQPDYNPRRAERYYYNY